MRKAAVAPVRFPPRRARGIFLSADNYRHMAAAPLRELTGARGGEETCARSPRAILSHLMVKRFFFFSFSL